MILTGRHVTAEEGRLLGFVTAVVPHESLMDEARNWAGQICECAPLSIRASMDVVYRSLDTASLEESMRAHYDSVAAHACQRGLHRRAQGVRRKAQTELERSLAPYPCERSGHRQSLVRPRPCRAAN